MNQMATFLVEKMQLCNKLCTVTHNNCTYWFRLSTMLPVINCTALHCMIKKNSSFSRLSWVPGIGIWYRHTNVSGVSDAVKWVISISFHYIESLCSVYISTMSNLFYSSESKSSYDSSFIDDGDVESACSSDQMMQVRIMFFFSTW